MKKNIKLLDGVELVDVKEKYYNQNGVLLFLHRPYQGSKVGWCVSEYYTGLWVGGGETMKKAELSAEENLYNHDLNDGRKISAWTKSLELINN